MDDVNGKWKKGKEFIFLCGNVYPKRRPTQQLIKLFGKTLKLLSILLFLFMKSSSLSSTISAISALVLFDTDHWIDSRRNN
jgi:hypothetical protein